ncbi:MCE family protein [Actinomadura sp. SCN-SB]|uniref:MCE family protein n=1 Tax=Actinomadura sp. SCN-SB TaxID=3373092 RepID=UPI003753AB00
MSDEPLSARSRALFGLLGAGVIAGAAVLVALGSTESHEGSTYLTASFGRAGQGLDPGRSDVKIRGITVGTVDAVTLERTGRVTVRVRMDRGVKVPRSATARIEPVSVFGPKDVDLVPGSGELTGPYLADGGRITRTRDPQDLAETAWPAHELTRAINPDELATILHTFAAGLSGEAPALRRTITNGRQVIDAAHANRAVIQSLIDDIAGVSGTLGSRGGTLNATIRDFNRLAPALNGRPDKVTRLLDESGRLAGTVGDTLEGHGRNLGTVIDTGGRIASVMAGQRHNIPVLIDSLNGFFALLSDTIRIKGPGNTLLGQQVNTLPLDLCFLLYDVCRALPGQGR